MPHVIVIAGPNGAGKSTAAPATSSSSTARVAEWRLYSNADPARRYVVADGNRTGLLTVYDGEVWGAILRQVNDDQAKS